MHTPPLFEDLILILLVSVPVAFLCLRLKLPLLVGLMLTGIGIGPYGFGLIKEREAIEILAEIGVMLLLFTIGLEFSLKRLNEMRRLVLVGGGLQVGLTVAATAAVAVLFGRAFNQAVFFGFLVALSSTAIVLKSYVERNEIDSPHGRAGVGVLLFQDISIVIMMLMVPVLGGKDAAASVGSVAKTLGGSILALVLIVVAAWFIVPQLFKPIVRLKSPEVLILTAVLITLGMSWLTSHFGLSLALGAFIAGMVLSESDYSHQITADILPFRDVFNSLFFVSIGMLLSVSSLIENFSTVLLWLAFLVIGKFLIVWTVVQLLGFPQRVSAMTALGLAQIGEFSFVLAKAAQGTELLADGADYQNFLAASIISMIATPFMIAAAPRVGYLFQSILPDKTEKESVDAEEDIHITSTGGLNNHVIIVGYGLNGRNLARVLRAVMVSYTILDLNAEVVREAKEQGEKINFGDATRREVLHHAHVENANALVLAMSDPHAARRCVKQARELNPNIYIVVRTRYTSEITELLELGADEVIPEEFETSIEIFARVLLRYGVDRATIEKQIEKVRRQGYEMLRSPSLSRVEVSNLNAALQSATTENVRLDETSPVIGKTLGELNLRGATGATLIAVVRGDDTKIGPGANFRLQAEDILILFGKAEKIDRAVEILQPDGQTGGFNP